MIEPGKGNLLEADVEALVNTVNCVGYMGKGIALQFKQAYPENFTAYQRAVRAQVVKPGSMFVFETGLVINPKFIINFPTKRHWRGKSRMEDIDSGLVALVGEIKERGIRSIAVPPLGCGNGGLDWSKVRPRILKALEPLPELRVVLYAPAGAPSAVEMLVRTEVPKMTTARALFVKAIDQYRQLAYRLTLLEIQKLAYFLQESGEPLRLRYEAGHYGPYAQNLNNVLERIEGHFIRGYGDSQKPDVEIDLLAGAVSQADGFLREHEESKARLERVSALISGFETPYGMELLSSVHWVAVHGDPKAKSVEAVTSAVHRWNDRKRNMFKPEHIVAAWERLNEERWV
ncbi:MAG: macro domain-containing protein [Bryobacter sp.]|jgi:O-acetyl-ADP-ribose deacetylase (regulator of RNase III)|nr:macro domain-containing protein [Bryobacter sp. CoA8 C33]